MLDMRVALSFSSALLAPLLGAQLPVHSEGPFAGAPAMFSVDLQTDLGTPSDRGAESYYKALGFSIAAPGTLSGPGRPDFRADTILRGCLGDAIPGSAPLPDIDAMSLGVDVVPVLSGGVVVIAPQSWSGFVFSVRSGTLGAPASLLRAELDRPDGNAADLFGYVFTPADCLPPEMVGRTHKVADATEIALPIGAEIDAVDIYAAMYGTGTAAFLGLPSSVDAYFSVTAATVDRVPASWWINPSVRSGASLFMTSWNGAQWSCPFEAFSFAALGLQACHDVDALAFEASSGKVVFSLVPSAGACPGFDPLLFAEIGAEAVGPWPLIYAGGGKVSTAIGLEGGTDDVDAICILDPQCGQRLRGLPIEKVVGDPWNHPASWLHPFFGQRLDAQVWRTARAGGFAYELYVVGGTPGALAVWLWAPTTVGLPNPLSQLPAVLNVPFGSPFLGSPTHRLSLPVPPGVDVLLYGATVTPAPFELRLTYPVRING